jgi:hypothetical protein
MMEGGYQTSDQAEIVALARSYEALRPEPELEKTKLLGYGQ